MPVIVNDSPPTTVDDFMELSALVVSPILTATIFDEISVQTSEELDADTLAISDTTNSSSNLSHRRHHRRSHLVDQGQTGFTGPAPSLRWRRRLERVVRSVAPVTSLDQDGEEEEESDDDYEDHIGPVMPSDDRGFPRTTSSHFIYGQHCLSDYAVNTSSLCTLEGENSSNMLDFDVIFDDGGQYGAMYGIENLLLNDGSVYCSNRKGSVNILTQYCGYIESGLIPDTSCTISTMIIKAPHIGFTAPCKEGLIFISQHEIDVSATSMFDNFTRQDYDNYISAKMKKNGGVIDDTDPAAMFTLKEDRLSIINLNNRAGKYVLIKLLRSDFDSDNIDLQYIGFIGYSGARSFGSAKLC